MKYQHVTFIVSSAHHSYKSLCLCTDRTDPQRIGLRSGLKRKSVYANLHGSIEEHRAYWNDLLAAGQVDAYPIAPVVAVARAVATWRQANNYSVP